MRTRAVTTAVFDGIGAAVVHGLARERRDALQLKGRGIARRRGVARQHEDAARRGDDEHRGAGRDRGLAATGELREAGEERQPERGVERLQLLGQAADVALVGAAGVAAADVAQDVLARAHAALVRIEQRGADVLVIGIACGARLDEVLARPRREHLRGRDADAELIGDLLGALAVELAGEQRGALADGQVGEVVDQPAQAFLAPQHGLGVLAVVARGGRLVAERLVAPARAPHLVDRPVACEAVQPRAQVGRDVAGEQDGVRTDEHVLHDVLRVVLGAAQERPRVADQRLAVARVEDREGFAVAGGDAAAEVGIIVSGSVEEGDHAWTTLF